jgi:hypothetical protein
LKTRLDSSSKAEQNWAVEQLTKAFVKMIPTEVTGKDGADLFPIPILNGMNVQPHIGNQENSPASKTD